VPAAGSPDRLYFERALERDGIRLVAGVDEAGRGPLAGPVVAAAVILPATWVRQGVPEHLRGLNDSKQLTASQRDRFYAELSSDAEVQWSIAAVEAAEIDAVNILRATHRAMARALGGLSPAPEHLLVDGLPVPELAWPQTALVKGDSLSYAIAAASVLAKVTRDRRMVEYDSLHPGYGFARHKGYPTPEHLEALERLGPSPIHRRSFQPVRAVQLPLL
jgi:ribonuclease HII